MRFSRTFDIQTHILVWVIGSQIVLFQSDGSDAETNPAVTLGSDSQENITATLDVINPDTNSTTPTTRRPRFPRYTITSILTRPYLFEVDPTKDGNSRYAGFIKDILEYIASVGGFVYDIKLVPDGQYGALDPKTKEWSGMIGQIIRREADIAAGPLTATDERTIYVDFAVPFQTTGPVIVTYAGGDDRSDRPLFRLLTAMNAPVWVLIIVAYVVACVVLWVVTRFSPQEKRTSMLSPISSNGETEWSMQNIMLFVASTLMWQGFQRSPRSVPGRMLAVIWWFFAVFTLVTYTAAVVATLLTPTVGTLSSMFSIQSFFDLASQSVIKYGVVEGGSTMSFFRNSPIEQYQDMWQSMSTTTPPSLVPTTEAGLERVRQGRGDYAFIMESAMALHAVGQPPCDLMVSSEPAAEDEYAFAVSRRNPWLRDQLDRGMLIKKKKVPTATLR